MDIPGCQITIKNPPHNNKPDIIITDINEYQPLCLLGLLCKAMLTPEDKHIITIHKICGIIRITSFYNINHNIAPTVIININKSTYIYLSYYNLTLKKSNCPSYLDNNLIETL